MAAYVIVDVEIIEAESYEAYRRRVPATLEPYGGRFLVRGGEYETLEGDWRPERIVVIEFPDVERAKAWHASPGYQEILPIRQQHARTNFLIVVEGIQDE